MRHLRHRARSTYGKRRRDAVQTMGLEVEATVSSNRRDHQKRSDQLTVPHTFAPRPLIGSLRRASAASTHCELQAVRPWVASSDERVGAMVRAVPTQ